MKWGEKGCPEEKEKPNGRVDREKDRSQRERISIFYLLRGRILQRYPIKSDILLPFVMQRIIISWKKR